MQANTHSADGKPAKRETVKMRNGGPISIRSEGGDAVAEPGQNASAKHPAKPPAKPRRNPAKRAQRTVPEAGRPCASITSGGHPVSQMQRADTSSWLRPSTRSWMGRCRMRSTPSNMNRPRPAAATAAVKGLARQNPPLFIQPLRSLVSSLGTALLPHLV